MVQLGARWYDPALGRFTQPDTIIPQPGNPQSFNRYSYVNNRPVNLVDPTGHQAECQSWDTTCWEDRYYNVQGLCRNAAGDYKRQCAPVARDKEIIEELWDINIEGEWTINELTLLARVVFKVKNTVGEETFRYAFAGVTFERVQSFYQIEICGAVGICGGIGTRPAETDPLGIMHVYNGTFSATPDFAIYTLIHEMGHAWDVRTEWGLSGGMANFLGIGHCNHLICTDWDINKGEQPPGAPLVQNPYAGKDPREDWAEAFAAYVYPEHFAENAPFGIGPERKAFVALQVHTYNRCLVSPWQIEPCH